MKSWKRLLLILCLAGVLGAAYWKFAIPTHRLDIRSEPAMREFVRDMIANLNGMYRVMTLNPDLLPLPNKPAQTQGR
jgi:hypothetical protein